MSSGTTSTTIAKDPLPAAFRIWVAGIVVSVLGNGVLYFALGWAATGHSGALAGFVLTAVNVPRAAFLLLGGAVGDRFGARPVLIAGDAIMTGLCVVLALAVHLTGAAVWILLLTGLVTGVVDAFYLPASGSMPRLLVPPEQLSRALGLRQGGGQLASLLAGPVGGLLVVSVGLTGVLLLDAVTFAVVLVTLLMIRPVRAAVPAPGGLAAAAVDGLRLSLADPVLRTVLLLMGAVGGLVLPVWSILVPLLAREHGWSAGTAGTVVGTQALGVIAVALLISRRGAWPRAGLATAGGTLLCATGIGVVALSPNTTVALSGALVAGLGVGVFAGHISPAVLTSTPQTHLSRVQAMLTLTQTLALLVTNNVVGPLADTTGAAPVTLGCALLVLAASLLALCSGPFRQVALP